MKIHPGHQKILKILKILFPCQILRDILVYDEVLRLFQVRRFL